MFDDQDFDKDFPPLESSIPEVDSNVSSEKISFVESDTAFKELQDFGENAFGLNSQNEFEVPVEAQGLEVPSESSNALNTAFSPESKIKYLMTEGQELPGYTIESIFPPISIGQAINLNDTDPLQPVFSELWKRATTQGANGVLQLKWVVSSDLTKVLVSGTPVSCKRK